MTRPALPARAGKKISIVPASPSTGNIKNRLRSAAAKTADLTKQKFQQLENTRKNLHQAIEALKKNSKIGKKNQATRLALLEKELKDTLTQMKIPVHYEWVLDIVDDVKLPYLGLPVKWDKTKEKHAAIAFDPKTNTSINIETGKTKKTKKSPIDFLHATDGCCPMPGAKKPASVRLTRYQEAKKRNEIAEDARADVYSICPTHGHFVKVESLETDHLQSKEDIKKRQIELVDYFNANPTVANTFLLQPGLNKFFVKVDNVYYGTLLFYEMYHNDIDNLWLICRSCNLHKTNENPIDFLKNNWLYGEKFLEHLEKTREGKKILDKFKNNKGESSGLAKIALEWFWSRHADYISREKIIFSDILKPLQELNQKIDRLHGEGNKERIERNKAQAEIGLAATTTAAQNTPRFSRKPSEANSSSPDTTDAEEDGDFVIRHSLSPKEQKKVKLKIRARYRLFIENIVTETINEERSQTNDDSNDENNSKSNRRVRSQPPRKRGR